MKPGYRSVSDPPPIDPQRLADVRAALEGLASDWYATGFLYGRYRSAMEAQGRDRVTPQAFGRMLTEHGCLNRNGRWLI